MTAPWELVVYENQRLVKEIEVPGPAELGRQEGNEEVFSCLPCDGGWRVVVADDKDKAISRHFLLVEHLGNGSFRLTNRSQGPVRLDGGREIRPGASCQTETEPLVSAGKKGFRLRAEKAEAALRGLDEATIPPGQATPTPSPLLTGEGTRPADGGTKALLRWLQSALDVVQSAADSGDFFARAARALAETVRLDRGAVLLRGGDAWQEEARFAAPRGQGGPGRAPSRRLLARVLRERRTFWEAPDAALADAESLREVEVVVVAPILRRDGEVLGVLYGDRRVGGGAAVGPITEVEAMLAELLARGVAAGLARLEQERRAVAARVRFEQFFGAELAGHLAEKPDLLRGRDAEVSVLFCDVRGFSRVSERLGPEWTMEWMGDVLSELSECVLREGGVLVDYVGDELMAMWGAPEPQDDHAVRACRAAQAMLACAAGLDGRWKERIGGPTAFGVGVNTGVARVGNSGLRQKFKYGPLGNTVNLASRVQGATKHLKCQLLITGATAAKLDGSFAPRRLCQVRVVNIEAPVELFELPDPGRPGWQECCEEYAQALAEFERQEFRSAALRLAALRARHPDDGPALVLLSRAVNGMVEEPSPFDPVWRLPSKG